MAHSNKADSFVGRLKRWKNDRGALANLRCALRPKLRSRAWPLLAQLTNLKSPSLVIYETVAGLWAMDPENHRTGCGNFGVTCRNLSASHVSFDLRFRRLIDCESREELCERIVPTALAAQAKGSVVDYDELFRDLQFYAGDGRDRVRLRWAQAYWKTVAKENDSEPATTNTATP
jgi:CRISPR system Cascade subunit CasB